MSAVQSLPAAVGALPAWTDRLLYDPVTAAKVAASVLLVAMILALFMHLAWRVVRIAAAAVGVYLLVVIVLSAV